MSTDLDILLFTKSWRKPQARKHRKGRGNHTELCSDPSDGKRARKPKDSRECYECHEIGHICGERKHFIRYTEYRKSEEREISDFAGRVAGKPSGMTTYG